MSRVPALVIAGPGTNRDHDVELALELAGASVQIVLAEELVDRPQLLDDARLAVVAGGFSYADSLGAGRMLALDLTVGLGDRLRGDRETIGERLARDLAVPQDLPATPYDACDKKAGRVSSLSLVRYRGNDYSVPTAYGHREVLIRGYVGEVVISCGADIIARHVRSYEREDFVFDPLHYLALIEQKTNALDQAAPLANWQLPDAFATLRLTCSPRLPHS